MDSPVTTNSTSEIRQILFDSIGFGLAMMVYGRFKSISHFRLPNTLHSTHQPSEAIILSYPRLSLSLHNSNNRSCTMVRVVSFPKRSCSRSCTAWFSILLMVALDIKNNNSHCDLKWKTTAFKVSSVNSSNNQSFRRTVFGRSMEKQRQASEASPTGQRVAKARSIPRQSPKHQQQHEKSRGLLMPLVVHWKDTMRDASLTFSEFRELEAAGLLEEHETLETAEIKAAAAFADFAWLARQDLNELNNNNNSNDAQAFGKVASSPTTINAKSVRRPNQDANTFLQAAAGLGRWTGQVFGGVMPENYHD